MEECSNSRLRDTAGPGNHHSELSTRRGKIVEYPTHETVKTADLETLCRWKRFLPSPGMKAIASKMGAMKVRTVIDYESRIMEMICSRIDKLGGMTPEISKRIGWDPSR